MPAFLKLGEGDYESIIAPALQRKGFLECTRAPITEARPHLWVEANKVHPSRDGKSISLLLEQLLGLRGAGSRRQPFTLDRKYRNCSQGENQNLRKNCTCLCRPFRFTRSKQPRQSHVSKGAP